MAKPMILEVHSSSDSEDENGKQVGAAEEAQADGAEEVDNGKIFDKNPADVAFASYDSVSNCIDKILAYKNFVSRVGNKLFSFSKKKAFGKFLALPKSEGKPTSMESNILQAYKLISEGFIGVQAAIKEQLDSASGMTLYSELIDKMIVKMYCKYGCVFRNGFFTLIIIFVFSPGFYRI